jgi:hypothetical protein
MPEGLQKSEGLMPFKAVTDFKIEIGIRQDSC